MMNENNYMMDMRSMGVQPGPMQQQQHQVTYAPLHNHHQNMNVYIHAQHSHLQHHLAEHKYPAQNIMIQHNTQTTTTHQISYVAHHPLINVGPQPPPKQELYTVSTIEKPVSKKSRTTKAKSKTLPTKIVKSKPPFTPQTHPPDPKPALPTASAEDKAHKKKGRKRKYAQSRQERKENMYKNLPYINSRNQEVKPKEFEDYDCKCPLKCKKRVSAEIRKQEFEAFYALGSYTAQNVFLLERIKEVNKKSKLPKVGKKKTKKKCQKMSKKKNFPKMSTKYKGNSFSSSDEDCKDNIVVEKDTISIDPSNKTKCIENSIECSPNEKKCDCSNIDCPYNINNASSKPQNYDCLNVDSSPKTFHPKSLEYPKNTDINVIISDQKNNLYQEYSNDSSKQIINIPLEVCSNVDIISEDQTIIHDNMSGLQVACSLPNTIQLITPNMNHSNNHVQQIICTEDPNQIHSELACVSIQQTQHHIIYTSDHIPYSDHQIIYQTQDLQDSNDCSTEEIYCTVQPNSFSHEIPLQCLDEFNIQSTETDQDEKVRRKRKPFKAERKFTRIYHLKKIRVCREMFVKTLKISSGRVNTVLKKNRSGDGLYRKSGNQGGHNKLTEEQKMTVCNHISSMLQFMAHNPHSPQLTESKMQQKSAFPSGFSLKSIYKVYKSNRDIIKPVSFTSYSRIFYKEFNSKKLNRPVEQKHDRTIGLPSMNQCGMQSSPDKLLYNRSNIRPGSSVHGYAQALEINTADELSTTDNQPKKKGRKRKYGDLTRQERKYNMYRNLPYVNSRKQEVLPKEFEDFDCGCPLKCRQRVSPKERQKEFEGYYNLGSYVAQNMYLLERVEECKKKRCYIKNRPAKRERNFSRVYKLSKVRVCREMFLKTLKISSVRVNTVLNKKRTGEELTYKRGLNQGGMNKITEEQRKIIVDHINCIISSLSLQHSDANGDLVFPQEYTFKKMYEIYLQNNQSGKSVSFSTYRRVFNERFDFKIL